MTSESDAKTFHNIEEFERQYFPSLSRSANETKEDEREQRSFGEDLARKSLDKFGALLRA